MKQFKSFVVEEYEFSSTHVKLPTCISFIMSEFIKKIPKDELAENGIETKPHITIKYGIHSTNPKSVTSLELPCKITVTLGKTSIFQLPNSDVLKIDVKSDDLHKLNALISSNVKTTDTFPEYVPHATLAYLKPGFGEKYVGDTTFEGLTWTFSKIEFSGSDDVVTEIGLS